MVLASSTVGFVKISDTLQRILCLNRIRDKKYLTVRNPSQSTHLQILKVILFKKSCFDNSSTYASFLFLKVKMKYYNNLRGVRFMLNGKSEILYCIMQSFSAAVIFLHRNKNEGSDRSLMHSTVGQG